MDLRTTNKPVIFTGFANPRGDLENLNREQNGIQKALTKLESKGAIKNHWQRNEMGHKDYFNAIQDWANQVAIFHFGGHANSQGLRLQDMATFFEPLAKELVARNRESLQLVFLNGCSTETHVKTLFDLGVKAVIATSTNVSDNLAAELAIRFYENLANGDNIKTAFKSSTSYIKARSDSFSFEIIDDPIEYRASIPVDDSQMSGSHWGLHVRDKTALEYVLPEPVTIPRLLTSIPSIELDQVVGQDTALKDITSLLNGAKQPLLINGASKVGKTTLAKSFLTANSQEFQHIAWLNVAGGDLKKAFAESEHLIDNLYLRDEVDGLEKDEAYNDKVFQMIINRMKSLEGKDGEGYNLLIIDDVDTDLQGAEMLTHITLAPHWKVLVTSREDLVGLKKYHLEPLSLEDTKKLFYLHYQYKLDEQQVELAKQQKEVDDLLERIIELDDYHTLNIKQIATKANAQKMTLQELLDTLKEKGVGVFIDHKSVYYERLKHNIKDNSDFYFHKTANLRVNMQRVNKALNEQGICYLQGMAGIGKTILAQEIANNKIRDDRYDIIWWLDADEGKIIPSLEEFAEKLAKESKIEKAKDKSPKENISEYLKDKRWLLIYDNACDTQSKEKIETFYRENIIAPDAAKKQQVLITSRNSNWRLLHDNMKEIELKYWTNKEIEEFFNQKDIKVPDKTQLDILGKLPLAVALARSYLYKRSKGKRSFTAFYEEWKREYDNLDIDGKLTDFKYSADHPKKSQDSNTEEEKDKSLFIVIKISFDNLEEPLQNLLKDMCCFAPDEIPMKVLYDRNKATQPFDSVDYHALENKLTELENFSFIAHQQNKQYSMHRFIQQGIRGIAKKEGQLETKVKNGVTLLKNAFKAKDPENWAFIPHVDAIFDQFKVLPLNEVKKDATNLFYEAGMFHYDMGETIRAEDTLEITRQLVENNPALEANVHKMLAKLLFLKGKTKFEPATDLANKAVQYFEQVGDVKSEVECKNEVLVKIRQRKCQFDKAQELFSDIEKIYTGDEKFKDKLSGMYHNIASLHWTWGRKDTPEGKGKNDYETSVYYFNKALEAGKETIRMIKKEKAKEKSAKEKRKQEGSISDRLLYQAVSRMIFGAVYGLLKEFDKQAEQHKQALTHFKNQAKEKRRLAYTAYYMLAYGWDKEALNAEDAHIGKCDYFEEEGFTEMELIQLIGDQKMYLATDEKEGEEGRSEEEKKKEEQKDEKYTLITKIVALRLAVRQETALEEDKNIPAIFIPESLEDAFYKLEAQLEEMKYTPAKDRVKEERYYDVDTCSVSAVLDYASYSLSVDKLEEAKEAAILAKAMTKDIMYHREPELASLCEKLGIAW